MAEYLDYIREPASGYVTVSFPVEDGMEIRCDRRAAGSQHELEAGRDGVRGKLLVIPLTAAVMNLQPPRSEKVTPGARCQTRRQ